ETVHRVAVATGGDDAGALVVDDLIGPDDRGLGAQLGLTLEGEDGPVPVRRALLGPGLDWLALPPGEPRPGPGPQEESEAERCHRGAWDAPTGSGRELQRDLVAVLSGLIAHFVPQGDGDAHGLATRWTGRDLHHRSPEEPGVERPAVVAPVETGVLQL